MSQTFHKRKISHRILEELGARPGDPSWEALRGQVEEEGIHMAGEKQQESTRVILRKADPFPILRLVDRLRELANAQVSGYTDFFVFARMGPEDVKQAGTFEEVNRIFLDEPVTAFLDYSVETTKALAVWNTFGHRGEGVTWAVVDSGINDQHPHFGGPHEPPVRGGFPEWWYPDLSREWFLQLRDEHGSLPLIQPGYADNTVVWRCQFIQGGVLHPHGSHIAGIIAGRATRMTQANIEIPPSPKLETVSNITGLAPLARLADFRVLDGDGKGRSSEAIKAMFLIRKINEEAGRIIIVGANLSLGYPYNPWDFGCGSSPLCEEADRLVHSGVLVVAAAGNSGYAEFTTLQLDEGGAKTYRPQPLFNFQSIADPGNAREVITVGSTHSRNPHRWGPSFFSSKGPTGDGRLKPDLLAPGEKITSCSSDFDITSVPPRLYLPMSGTSQAAAQVSGGLALFLSVHPEFIGRPLEVKEKLLASCTDLKRERYHQGFGLLDIFRLVQSV